MIAEGDYVVLQGHRVGRKTKSGQPYNDTVCYVFKLANGKSYRGRGVLRHRIGDPSFRKAMRIALARETHGCSEELKANAFGGVVEFQLN